MPCLWRLEADCEKTCLQHLWAGREEEEEEGGREERTISSSLSRTAGTLLCFNNILLTVASLSFLCTLPSHLLSILFSSSLSLPLDFSFSLHGILEKGLMLIGGRFPALLLPSHTQQPSQPSTPACSLLFYPTYPISSTSDSLPAFSAPLPRATGSQVLPPLLPPDRRSTCLPLQVPQTASLLPACLPSYKAEALGLWVLPGFSALPAFCLQQPATMPDLASPMPATCHSLPPARQFLPACSFPIPTPPVLHMSLLVCCLWAVAGVTAFATIPPLRQTGWAGSLRLLLPATYYISPGVTLPVCLPLPSPFAVPQRHTTHRHLGSNLPCCAAFALPATDGQFMPFYITCLLWLRLERPCCCSPTCNTCHYIGAVGPACLRSRCC